MADGTRSRNRRANNPPPATDPSPATGNRGGARGGTRGGNRGGARGGAGAGGRAPTRDPSPTALQRAQNLEFERLARVAQERLAEEARVAQEAREEAVRRQQADSERMMEQVRREEEEEANTRRRNAMRGRTTPDPPDITRRGRNPMEAAGLTGNAQSRAARRARDEWQAAQDRQAEASDRAQARIAKEQEEWAAEVAQFGEEEASRRRREEREWRKKQGEDLPTSEIDQMALEDQCANPMITITAALRVNKKLVWSDSAIGTMAMESFSIWDFDARLAVAMDKMHALDNGWEIINRMVIVKAKHSRATNQIQSIDDFSEAEWAKAVSVITREAAQYTPELTVKIEISAMATAPAKAQSKRPYRETLSSDPIDESAPQSRRRITTTDKRLDQARERAEALHAAGNWDKDIIDRWQCRDSHCRNENGFCFVDFAGKHYDISHKEQLIWAKAIANGQANVSLERPPTALYNIWVKQHGSVAQSSRRSEAHQERLEAKAERAEKETHMNKQESFMDKLMKLSEQEMNMAMAERMAERAEKMSRRSQQQDQPALPPTLHQWPQQWQQQWSQQPPWHQQPPQWPQSPWLGVQLPPTHPQYQQWSSQYGTTQPQCIPPASSTPLPPSYAPPPPATAPPTAPAAAAPPARKEPEQGPTDHSSPMASTRNEEETILEGFFQWQIGNAQGERAKRRWRHAQDIVLDQAWTIDDLKAMSDPSSRLYQIAIDRGLPDGVTRNLKADLKTFKPFWREAKGLLDVANGVVDS